MQIVEAHGDSVISDFGVVLDSAGNYQFLQTDETLKTAVYCRCLWKENN